MLAALKKILAIFMLGAILLFSGCAAFFSAATMPNESQRNAERARQKEFVKWNHYVDTLPACQEGEKTDDEIKRLFFENVVKDAPLPSYSFRNVDLADFDVIRDETHAPHRAYLSFEEFVATNGETLVVRRSDRSWLAQRGFKGTLSGAARFRNTFPDNILYQGKTRGTRPIPGQAKTNYYFDNCGRFIYAENPHERRVH